MKVTIGGSCYWLYTRWYWCANANISLRKHGAIDYISASVSGYSRTREEGRKKVKMWKERLKQRVTEDYNWLKEQ
jgi:hypothetical protein